MSYMRLEKLDEPDWQVDYKALPEGEYYVLGWIPIQHTNLEDRDGKQALYEIPLFRYSHRYIAPENIIYRKDFLETVARRIRNYLSFAFGTKIPICYRWSDRN